MIRWTIRLICFSYVSIISSNLHSLHIEHVPKRFLLKLYRMLLIHWSRVMRICISKLNINGSDNGLSPGQRPAIIWTSACKLLIRLLTTGFSEILSKVHTFSFKKLHLKTSSAKWRQICVGINVLTYIKILSCILYLTYRKFSVFAMLWLRTLSYDLEEK